jgi:Ca-activated chloride channel homolog
VLESDGKQTVPEKLDDPRGGFTAARAAKAKNVPISTISFGTTGGTVDIPNNDTGGTDRVRVPVDDASLREIADLSGGSFFSASSLDQLRQAYDTLEEQIGYEIRRGDASRPWLIAASLVLAAAFAAALVTRQRIP